MSFAYKVKTNKEISTNILPSSSYLIFCKYTCASAVPRTKKRSNKGRRLKKTRVLCWSIYILVNTLTTSHTPTKQSSLTKETWTEKTNKQFEKLWVDLYRRREKHHIQYKVLRISFSFASLNCTTHFTAGWVDVGDFREFRNSTSGAKLIQVQKVRRSTFFLSHFQNVFERLNLNQ